MKILKTCKYSQKVLVSQNSRPSLTLNQPPIDPSLVRFIFVFKPYISTVLTYLEFENGNIRFLAVLLRYIIKTHKYCFGDHFTWTLPPKAHTVAPVAVSFPRSILLLAYQTYFRRTNTK